MRICSCRLYELIDTLWNVNKIGDIVYFDWHSRINRYIMECKFLGSIINAVANERINRYIMECKWCIL